MAVASGLHALVGPGRGEDRSPPGLAHQTVLLTAVALLGFFLLLLVLYKESLHDLPRGDHLKFFHVWREHRLSLGSIGSLAYFSNFHDPRFYPLGLLLLFGQIAL